MAASRVLAFLIGATRSVSAQRWEVAAWNPHLSRIRHSRKGRQGQLGPHAGGFPALGTLCPWAEGTFGGNGGVVVFQGLGDKATLPPQDKPHKFPSAQGWRRGSGAGVLEEGWGSVWLRARMNINRSLTGSPVLISSLAPEWFPPSEKPLLGASHISPAARGELAPSLPPASARACHYQHFSRTKKSTNFLIVSCWS